MGKGPPPKREPWEGIGHFFQRYERWAHPWMYQHELPYAPPPPESPPPITTLAQLAARLKMDLDFLRDMGCFEPYLKSLDPCDSGTIGRLREAFEAIDAMGVADCPVNRATPNTLSEGTSAMVQMLKWVHRKLATDIKADTGKKSWRVLPQSHDLLKLAKKIKHERPIGLTLIEIAREFTNNDERRAKSLLRQLRRYPDLTD